jgi:hypothetical protein
MAVNSTGNNNSGQGSGILDEISTLLENMASNSLDLITGKYRAKSIAERARKSIMMYKVAVSTSVSDLDLAGKISKYLESMYAIFTMINLGYNPLPQSGDEISKVIQSVSAENYDPLRIINRDANRALSVAMKFHEERKRPTASAIGRNAVSSAEASLGEEIGKGILASLEEDRARRKAFKSVNATNAQSEFKTTSFINKLEEKSVGATPTIVNLKVGKGKDSTVDIPLAIKTNLYGIGTEEIKGIIEQALSGKAYNILRFVKWRTGELSTLAWLFNTDIADKDRKLYKNLGKNPWYIDLSKRKMAAKGTSFAKFFVNNDSGTAFSKRDEYKAVKADINALKDLPPTASLVITKNDLTTATNLNITHFMKNEGLLKNIMKKLYLLCFAVVDPDTETVMFFFDGYTQPFIQKFSDLSKDKDPNQAMLRVMEELARRS